MKKLIHSLSSSRLPSFPGGDTSNGGVISGLPLRLEGMVAEMQAEITSLRNEVDELRRRA